MFTSLRAIHYVLFLFLLPFNLLSSQEQESPIAVYLTWQKHPESTMTILWITSSADQNSFVEYQMEGESEWLFKTGTATPLPEGYERFVVHSVEIEELKPNSRYGFKLEPGGDIYTFRTMPQQLRAPIRFIVGGDVYHDSIDTLIQMNRVAASRNPAFVLLGGDLAYASPKDIHKKENGQRWLDFIRVWYETMVTLDGDLIPLIPSTSNEDTKGRYDQTPAEAPFFYTLFPMPGKQGYNVLDFSSYMSIFILDSGHTHPIQGEQTAWLQKTLDKRTAVPFKFALYHVPAYPSVRGFYETVSPVVRRYWIPEFEKYGLTTAFEHHDHAYKRTHPIRQNKIDPTGVLYIGDGGWGVNNIRQPCTPDDRFYLAFTAAKRNFILVNLQPDRVSFYAIDDLGRVFDTTQRSVGRVVGRQ